MERSPLERAQTVLAVIGFITAIVAFAKLLADGWSSIDVVLLWVGTAYLVAAIAGWAALVWFAENPWGRLLGVVLAASGTAALVLSFAYESYDFLYAFAIVGAALSIAAAWPEYQREQKRRQARVRTCPDCAENVKAEARVCRYCGYRFERTVADPPPRSEPN